MGKKTPASKPAVTVAGSVKDSNIIVGNNNVITTIRRYVFRDVRQLIVLIVSVLLVAGGIGGAYWYSIQPQKMPGNFNIAVARFGEIQANGSITPSARAEKIGDTLFNFLDSEYRASGFGLTIQVGHKNIPMITEDAQAEKLAKQINADIVIYGNVYVQGDQAEFSPRFYVAERPDTKELTGQNELALPIEFSISDLGFQDKVNAELRTRTAVLFNFTKALIYFSQKETDPAILSLESAIAIAEKSGQTFPGQEVLYLLDADIQINQKHYDSANQLLDKALTLNPQYARAHLARGNIFYEEATNSNFDPGLIDQAQAEYQIAYQMPNQPEGAYIPIKAHTLLGNVLVVKAQMTNNPDLFKQAIENYSYVTDQYQHTKDPFLRDYASIAYFGLGAAYERQAKAGLALQAYQQAYELADDPGFKARIQQQMNAGTGVAGTSPANAAAPSSSLPLSNATLPPSPPSIAMAGAGTQVSGFNPADSLSSVPTPTPIAPILIPVTGGGNTNVIVAGWAHTCAVMPEGGVQCWGKNEFGQLGDGSNKSSNVPVSVVGLQGVTHVVAGGNHTCALTKGAIWCWGQNDKGQIGDGTIINRNAPVKVLDDDTAVSLTAGFDHTCAVMLDSKVMCWGNNEDGQLGDGTRTSHLKPTLALNVDISGLYGLAGGNSVTCGFTPAGIIKCWGDAADQILGKPSAETTALAGFRYVMPSRFSAYAIGINEQGMPVIFQAGLVKPVNGLNSILYADGGLHHACALTAYGMVKCWGSNDVGQLGDNSTTDSSDPVTVLNLSSAIDLAVGANHTCAILITTTSPTGIRCWGLNTDGQLGDGTNRNSLVPVDVR